MVFLGTLQTKIITKKCHLGKKKSSCKINATIKTFQILSKNYQKTGFMCF